MICLFGSFSLTVLLSTFRSAAHTKYLAHTSCSSKRYKGSEWTSHLLASSSLLVISFCYILETSLKASITRSTTTHNPTFCRHLKTDMPSLSVKSIMLLAVAAMLSVPICTCKCKDGSGNAVDGATESCCAEVGGVWQDGNDCQASSISELLSNFETCCQQAGTGTGTEWTSDCSCPTC